MRVFLYIRSFSPVALEARFTYTIISQGVIQTLNPFKSKELHPVFPDQERGKKSTLVLRDTKAKSQVQAKKQ